MVFARGFPVVLSAPSGGGKTTIAMKLVAELPYLRRSCSTTTRPPRSGEEIGRDYEFVTDVDFERRIAAGGFAEWASVHGHRYGTSKEFVESVCQRGACPLLVIDVQGGLTMKRYDPQALLLFLMPHSLEEMEHRLRSRETDAQEAMQIRLHNARREIEEAVRYDYIITNDQLRLAIDQIRHILKGVQPKVIE